MKQRRDVSNWQVLGVLVLIASGVASLALFAVADAFGTDSQHCLHNGPFPAVEQGVLEGGSVSQHWQWAPLGLRCDWHYPDGGVVTTSAAWSRNLLGAGVVVGAAVGAVLTLRRGDRLH